MPTRIQCLTVALLAALSVAAAAGQNGYSPLADASMRGETETVRSLLRQGADVNAAQGDGMTALHWAALQGDAATAEMLLYAGANLKATTRLGSYTPLLLAAKSGNAPLLRALVGAGADLNATTATGATPLMLAAGAGDPEAVSLLLEQGLEVDAPDSSRGQTALMYAAAANRLEAVRLLLDGGADPARTSKVVDVTKRAEKASKERRERGKRIEEARKAADEKARAAAQAQAGPGSAAETSAESAEARAGTRKKSRQAKQKASGPPQEKQEGKSFFARFFSWFGSSKPKAEEPRRRSLSLAELVGHQGGMTALLYAAREGHIDTVRALLEGGADVNQVSGGDQTSPLLVATANGRFDTAMFLLERGADPNLASAAGAAPLYAAVNVQWAPHAFYPQPITRNQQTTHLELMKALLDHGADPNRRLTKKVWYTGYNFDQSGVDEAGATAFWRAAQSTDVEAMRLLVEAGADPHIPTIVRMESKDPSGQTADENKLEDVEEEDVSKLGDPAVTPLQVASGAGYDGNYHRNAPGGWLPAVEYLVEELGADVNAADHNGYTPLHNAAARGDNEMILYLVSKGADVGAVSKKGQTTADMANGPIQRIQPFPETLALLTELGAKNSNKCVSC